MRRTAIVTGVTGQDGSYLADLLLEKDYNVYGLKRRTSSNSLECAAHLASSIEIVEGDLADLPSLQRLCQLAKADEFYNMAAQSHVGTSFNQPVYTAQATALGVLNCLEAIRHSGLHTRFLQASTSELFGDGGTNRPAEGLSLENTPFYPRSPYGVAKLYGFWITKNYRESYKMFAANSVAFNHESPRRGPQFVTRKIAIAVGKIKRGEQDYLHLGNIDACRDWGHAADYVDGMWRMLQHGHPEDFVLATGETYSVKDFCFLAFQRAGLDYRQYVKIDPTLYRPAEIEYLRGDARRAHELLGWKPKIEFKDLVNEMVDAELNRK